MIAERNLIFGTESEDLVERLHTLALLFGHSTELAAIAAARTAGYGNKVMSDQAAVTAMREYFNTINMSGTIVIGEGERDKAPMLYIGEKVGKGNGMEVDIAVDPLENTNATAVYTERAISVLAVSEKGGLFAAPDMYMNKLVVGHEARGHVEIDRDPKYNLKVIADSLEREIKDLTVVILKRDRNVDLIRKVLATGARVRQIEDGDLMPAAAACMSGTGVHAVMGIGAAPEGVISAAAVRALGGGMQARFWYSDDDIKKKKEQIDRLKSMGGDYNRVYRENELARGKILIFSATGVTDGDILKGVSFFGGGARTKSLIITWTEESTMTLDLIDRTHRFDPETILHI